MLKSKGVMAAASIGGAIILIYGTAIIFRLLFGGYLFDGGLTNFNYGVLALLCAVPFVLIALAGKNNGASRNALVIAGLLFAVLFVLVHLVLVVSGEELGGAMLTRTLVIFPAGALLLAVIVYFAAGRENAV